MRSQQDGCPAHYSQNVQDLSVQFTNQWIRRNSIFPCPYGYGLSIMGLA